MVICCSLVAGGSASFQPPVCCMMMKSRRDVPVDRSSSPDLRGRSKLSLAMPSVRASGLDRDRVKLKTSTNGLPSPVSPVTRPKAIGASPSVSAHPGHIPGSGRREASNQLQPQQASSNLAMSPSPTDSQVRRSTRATATSWTTRFGNVKRTSVRWAVDLVGHDFK